MGTSHITEILYKIPFYKNVYTTEKFQGLNYYRNFILYNTVLMSEKLNKNKLKS